MKRVKNATLPVIVPADPGSTANDQTFAGFNRDELYDTRQLAAGTGQAVAFYEARRAKDLPPRAIKLGRSVKYLGADIIAFLKAGYQGGDHE